MKKNTIQVGGKIRQIGNPSNREAYNVYITSIAKYKTLSKEEEVELFKELAKSDNKKPIKDKICLHNLLFVVSVAKKYHSTLFKNVLTLEDLISEGNLGLYEAVDRFDYKTGNKFITYAVWWIRQFILKLIQENIKTVRTPNNKQDLIKWVKRKTEELEQEYGRDIDVKELYALSKNVKHDGSSNGIGEFIRLIEASKYDISLSTPLSDDNTTTMLDMVVSDDKDYLHEMVNEEIAKNIDIMLGKLPVTIRNYFIDYYGLNGATPLTFNDIGDKYEISGESIRNYIKKYLRVLRHKNKTKTEFFFQ